MCGIFLIVNGAKNRSANMGTCSFIKDSFICNTVRGDDSTGLMQLDKKKDMYMWKEPVTGSQFVENTKVQKYIRDVDTTILTVGHNRAATAGVVSQQNAHPFSHTVGTRTVTGVHNGTLEDWSRATNGKDFKVDSDWAIHTLAREGSVDAFEYFKGAFTFVWYDDSTPNVLNIARNSKRPMYFAYVKDKDIMVAASEPGMLSWLTARNGVDIEGIIYQTDEDMHYRFDLDNPREFTKEALVKVDYTKFNFYQATTVRRKAGSSYGMYDDADWGNGDSWTGYTRHWSERDYTPRDAQAEFIYKMHKLLGSTTVEDVKVVPTAEIVKKEEKKESVIILPNTSSMQEALAELAEQDSEFDLGEFDEGVYASERDLAVQLGIKGVDIWASPISYDATNGSAYMEFVGVEDIKFDDDKFKDAELLVIRDVSIDCYNSLQRAQLVKVAVQGAYYLAPNKEDLTLIVDNTFIKTIRKSIKTKLAV